MGFRGHLLTLATVALCTSAMGDTFMGDWQGTFTLGKTSKTAVAQVIAKGDNTYEAHVLDSFDASGKPLLKLSGEKRDDVVVLTGTFQTPTFKAAFSDAAGEASLWTGTIDGNSFTCSQPTETKPGQTPDQPPLTFTLEKTVRLSPTLGKPAPKNATVLLGADTANLDAWENIRKKRTRFPAEWALTDGVMEVTKGKGNIVTKQSFGSHRLHLEFRLPLMPGARGQKRGNSGVYVFGRYETQILDSYALAGRDNECGGIYKAGPPRINMCAPPLQWQTYDIDFTAPTFDTNGVKKTNARMTVLHNGVNIQNDIELNGSTPGGVTREEAEKGPLFLQDHSNPVQFRNIWIEEK